ncbi:hypothetical protein V8G54_016866 [Vigna mungo]|uniref:Uncharacterized protein n=1 Tax=Vigna mungo TaxID=3915 RepID=A0AAQ3NNT7_VIGMU
MFEAHVRISFVNLFSAAISSSLFNSNFLCLIGFEIFFASFCFGWRYVFSVNPVKGDSDVALLTGDVVLKDLKLKAEALNALKLPVTVKAGFVGTITLKSSMSENQINLNPPPPLSFDALVLISKKLDDSDFLLWQQHV